MDVRRRPVELTSRMLPDPQREGSIMIDRTSGTRRGGGSSKTFLAFTPRRPSFLPAPFQAVLKLLPQQFCVVLFRQQAKTSRSELVGENEHE